MTAASTGKDKGLRQRHQAHWRGLGLLKRLLRRHEPICTRHGMACCNSTDHRTCSASHPYTHLAQVQLGGTTLWLQDLFCGSGRVRLLAPALVAQSTPPASSGKTSATDPSVSLAAPPQPWLLLLLSERPVNQFVAAGSVEGTHNAQLPVPQLKVSYGSPVGIAAPAAAVAAAESTHTAAAAETDAAAAAAPAAALSLSQPPALCFRFNSPGEGRAFQSLLTAAERVKEAVQRRGEEQRRGLEQRRVAEGERLRRLRDKQKHQQQQWTQETRDETEPIEKVSKFILKGGGRGGSIKYFLTAEYP